MVKFLRWPHSTTTLLLCASAMLALSGCANMGPGSAAHPFWPKPPERARIIYEGVIHTELDIVKESKTDLLRASVAGSNPRASIAFVKPYDVAARKGRIVVSDSANDIVNLFDIPQGQLFRIGLSTDGKLQQASGVTIDVKGNIYVADAKAKRVVMYDPLGHFAKSIGNGEVFSRPADVAVSNAGDRIYVVDLGGLDSQKHRVVVFNPDGKMLFTFGTHGMEPGQLHLASHLAVGPDDNIYVLDTGNFRVQVFDRDGKYLRHWGKVGVNFGNLARPRGIAIDADGNVYVTDATFGNFQVFDPTGHLLMWIGNTGLEDKPGQYALPAGIAVDESNHIYVVDQLYTKVEVLRRLTDDESDRLARNLPLNSKLNAQPATLTPSATPPAPAAIAAPAAASVPAPTPAVAAPAVLPTPTPAPPEPKATATPPADGANP